MTESSVDKPDLTGRWILDRNDENFDAYLSALGMNWFVRKMVRLASPTIDISIEGEKVTVATHTPKGDLVDSFTPGDEFEMNNPMSGLTEKKKGYWDGDTLVIEPVERDDLPVVKRAIRDGFMETTASVKGVTTVRYFKKK